MTKSYVGYLQDLYTHVLVDVCASFPELGKDLERDLSRILFCLEKRGSSFATIELPALGKHFDQCLAQGRLTQSGMAHSRPYKTGVVIPRLFKGLLRYVFEDSGAMLVKPDVHAIRCLRQLYYGAKKIKMECSRERLYQTVEEFFRIEEQLRLPSLDWDGDRLDYPSGRRLNFRDNLDGYLDARPSLPGLEEEEEGGKERIDLARLLDIFQDVCDRFASSMGTFTSTDYLPKHGRGAVSDLVKSHTSKYEFPTWSDKLDAVFPLSDLGFPNLGLWADAVSDGSLDGRFENIEAPSKLIAVPKTQKAPRLIAKESTSHQWCQQIILRFFVDKTKHRGYREGTFVSNPVGPATPFGYFVDFQNQQVNRMAALRASMHGDTATVDLSAASDRVSCWTVERAFRSNLSLLDALHASRTRVIENTLDKRFPRFHRLRKFASMGSACTFPVESFIFAAAAVAATLYKRHGRQSSAASRWPTLIGTVHVFGDDIIIPVDALDSLGALLDYLQLKVNRDKTFGTGKFRESCGMDAFDGADVTPTYVSTIASRDRPESVSSAVAVHNNFFGSHWYNVAAWLESTIRRLGYAFPYVVADSGSFGFHRHYQDRNLHLKRRLNYDLQCVEYLLHKPKAKCKKVDDRGISSLLQYFTEAPEPTTKWKAGFVTKTSNLVVRRWSTLLAD